MGYLSKTFPNDLLSQLKLTEGILITIPNVLMSQIHGDVDLFVKLDPKTFQMSISYPNISNLLYRSTLLYKH